jgi:hypothetical protein
MLPHLEIICVRDVAMIKLNLCPSSGRHPTKQYYHPHYPEIGKIMSLFALTLQEATRISNRFTSLRNHNSSEEGYGSVYTPLLSNLHVLACQGFALILNKAKPVLYIHPGVLMIALLEEEDL